ncbi:MAG TPA: type III pantothenate kinase [bacterium]|uniref:Type III pantothenate kinase n=1 Tax=candidate division TA06 bacterium ADurb.Bin417 TaxID=1852828 RepID=A0A1V5MFQ9_UNCT6|nr:MAG: Type III pantothenate kinase [candidate division TA06 bacterium ADurb.Bin417]HNQ34690.1 type III pantothenate kinase [bacterium]HNS48063.1 type III pantothenate kinase [bacterium]
MLLAIDLGNTTLKAVLFDRDGTAAWRVNLRHHNDGARLEARIAKAAWPTGITAAALASVVPDLSGPAAAGLARALRVRPELLDRSRLPLAARVTRPESVGVDRLLNALAAGRLHGKPAVVIDAGTALTLDLVDPDGAYAGGVIAPGPELARDSLAERTALLPRIELKAPASVVGKDTESCLQAGLVLGFAELVNGLVERLRREWRPEFKLVGTGGSLKILLPHLRPRPLVDPDLTLRGIWLALQKK